jgi:hypothetical protein
MSPWAGFGCNRRFAINKEEAGITRSEIFDCGTEGVTGVFSASASSDAGHSPFKAGFLQEFAETAAAL